jgi:hypothetical protein
MVQDDYFLIVGLYRVTEKIVKLLTFSMRRASIYETIVAVRK